MNRTLHPQMLSNLELSDFCSQISMLLRAGISVPEALHLLLSDAGNEAERSLLSQMIEETEHSGLLFCAAECSGVFPPYALHMIQIGEETGTLDSVLEALSLHYIREENLKQMIKSAFLYPGILLFMMCFILCILLTKVLPVFQQVFMQFGLEIQGLPSMLLSLGRTLSRYSVLLLIFVSFLALLLFVFRKKLSLPRRMQDKLSACRFADGMSIALKSGMTPEQGLSLTYHITENIDFQKKLDVCQAKLSEGMDFSDALTQSGIFTGSCARMASVAGKAGTLDLAMEKIAAEYEYAVNHQIASRIALLEPTLVILLSLLVGVILFSVMMPLLGIMSAL